MTINVSDESGTSAGTATSAADGKWSVAVKGPGTYKVDLDTTTLPQGVTVTNGRPSLTLTVFEGAARNVLFPLGSAAAPGSKPVEAPGSSTTDRVFDLIYTGIHFGLIIALAALGLSLIFGTMGLTNFAHGELITFGALGCFAFNVWAGLPLVVSALLAVILGGAFGYFQDRLFWGWLRNRRTGLIGMMIISIGAALVLRYLFLFFFRGDTRQYAEYVAQPGMDLGVISVAPKNLVMDVVAIIVLIGVSLALTKTRLGKATRAVSTNPSLAAASGISVDSIIRLVWTIGGALAALSGVMLGLFQGVNYQMGFQILLLVFAAVTLGGLGTAFGALIGSLVVGLATQLSTLWIPTELKNVGALVVLIVIILFRPQGILGRRERIG
ncbi:branched-chain amino acid ABC transporter permease [Actinoplanes sp. HUAS TT8]|uniref:branched-chain amino acid ABC transporter permease n=1 Tax=Actinoplanes sp. HUAS TT8 TaxID=3447453 RepID=UPI003F522EA7